MSIEYLDALDSLHLRVDGLYERFETNFVKRTLGPGQVFVDAGAHIGYYSVLAAEIVGPGGKVHAFEPHPDNYELLRKNTEAVRDIVRTYPFALSDSSGIGRLYMNLENTGDNRMFESPGMGWIEASFEALDDTDELFGKGIDFLKIDTQGFEVRVLAGARSIIKRSPNLKGIIEYAPKHLRLAGYTPADFFSQLVDLGLKVYERAGDKLVPADFCALSGIGRHVNLFFGFGDLA